MQEESEEGVEEDVQEQADDTETTDEEDVQEQADDEEDVQEQADDTETTDEEDVQEQADDEEDVQEQADDEEEVQEQAEGPGDEEDVQEQAEEPGEEEDGASVQAKVSIGPRGDRYEQEADAAADAAAAGHAVGAPTRVARRPKPAGAPDGGRGATQPRPTATAAATRAVRSSEPGSPITSSTRAKLEPLFGTDLTSVRVHDSAAAGDAAAAMRAKAFTHGRHIWLGRGQSQKDVRLMAHETTHVLQQGGVVRRAPLDTVPVDAAAPETDAGTEEEQVPAEEHNAPPTERGEAGEEAPTEEGEATVAGPAPSPAEAPEADAEGETPPVAEEGADEDRTDEPPPAGTETDAVAPAGPDDPRFRGVTKRLERAARQERAHEPATKKVTEAHAAVEPPDNEVDSRAQGRQVEVMAEQPAGKPEKENFLTLLRQQLRAIAPKNMKETDEFKKKGKARDLKATLTANVTAQKDASASAITAATKADPDPSGIPAKEVVAIPESPAEEPAPDLRAREVLPLPKPDEDVSVEQNKDEADRLMAENDIDEAQLERAKEPQFSEALEAKKELDSHVEQVPAAYREQEEGYLAEAEADVAAEEAAAKRDMRADREHAKDEVQDEQEELKKKEEAERLKITGDIEAMYQATTKKVEGKLERLDEEVNQLFDEGEKRARDRFETDVSHKMSAYKWHRYISRVGGSVLWLKDRFTGMPDEVNRFYEDGREQYIADMEVVIVGIADTVEARLQEVRDDIAEGRRQILEYVDRLPEAQRTLGQEAQEAVSAKFDDLESDVENKKQELASQLADRYEKAREELDERIEELKAANQGLLDAFIGKLRQIIEILRAFKDRIVPLLRTGADTVRSIIKDPIGFLGNLLAAVKKGFDQFSGNILVHLKKGLATWLFGTMAKAGVELPTEFSPKAVFGLVLQVLGLTRERIRAKVVRLVGAKNVERLEKAWSLVSTVISEGPAGLWARAKDTLADLKDTVIGRIRDWVVARVVEQAVIWLVSLFNPAAALLKAIRLIYDVVMFFVQNIERVLDLVEAVITSVAKIVAGAIGAAANWIEAAMGRTVPVVIGFMARLLRLGEISETVKSIIRSIQKRVDKVIDKVLAKIVRGIKKVLQKGKAAAKRGVAKLVEWWTIKKRFKAGPETHALSFRGKGERAEAMVASAPTPLRSFVDMVAARPENQEGDKKLAIKTIREQMAEIDRLKKLPKKEGETAAKGIRSAFDIVAANLVKVAAGDDLGTASNPVPIDYPKRSSAAYLPLFLGPRAVSVPQSVLKEGQREKVAEHLPRPSRQKWVEEGAKIEQYRPHERKALPDGGREIGLVPDWQIAVGKQFRLKPARSKGGGKLNRALKPYGFRPSEERLDADHVTERQIGGPDELFNLWPLGMGENRAAGSILSKATFDKPGGKTMTMGELKQRAKKQAVWIVIAKTK